MLCAHPSDFEHILSTFPLVSPLERAEALDTFMRLPLSS